MATLNEYLESIIEQAQQIQKHLNPKELAVIGPVETQHILTAARKVDSALDDILDNFEPRS